MKAKLAVIVGARPNLVKAAPLIRELKRFSDLFNYILIHTGQHYGYDLFWRLFEDLEMETPDIVLGIGSATLVEQTSQIMRKLENVFLDKHPDLVIVFGDVSSTVAASMAASKLHIKVAHIESGLRSFDLSMPEELNRIVTDRLSDFLFVTEPSGLDNLAREGISSSKIYHTGNIMIDSLINTISTSRNSDILLKLGLVAKQYAVLTLHRPSNVDLPEKLLSIIEIVRLVSLRIPIVFPCHPRTQKQLSKYDVKIFEAREKIRVIDPLGYSDFLNLQAASFFVLTDSGGVQEETTYLRIPCLTLRDNTERPITVEVGSNVLVGHNPGRIAAAVSDIFDGKHKLGNVPALWDGRTAERVVSVFRSVL